jgi:hypothetical protein
MQVHGGVGVGSHTVIARCMHLFVIHREGLSPMPLKVTVVIGIDDIECIQKMFKNCLCDQMKFWNQYDHAFQQFIHS